MKTKNKVILWGVLVIVVAAIAWFVGKGELFGKKNGSSATTDGKTYYAVFLTNGQVYFGILKSPSAQYAEMTDIYYLQVAQQDIQPPADQKDQQQTKLELVKLGNELHGPKDKMQINRDHILFYEAMKNDGQVVQTIQKDKASKAQEL